MVYDFFEELKEIIKEKIKCFFSKFKYLIILIVLILLVLSIFKLDKLEPDTIDSQKIYLFGITIENWAQWITIIALPYTAGWAIFQFKKERDTKKQEKAIQIAEEFSKTIVDDLYMINDVYTDSYLLNYMPLKEEQTKLFKYFNVDEIRRIYKDDNSVTVYKSARNNLKQQIDNLYHIKLYQNFVSYSDKDYTDLINKALKGTLSKEELDKIDSVIMNIPNVPYHFAQLKSKTLNKLEYICMDISSKAADSNYIYQSLHQIFLRTIRTLYMDISIVNTNSTDKFYTNIIHVYNSWKNKYLKEQKLEERKIKKSNEKINPKTKTV